MNKYDFMTFMRSAGLCMYERGCLLLQQDQSGIAPRVVFRSKILQSWYDYKIIKILYFNVAENLKITFCQSFLERKFSC